MQRSTIPTRTDSTCILRAMNPYQTSIVIVGGLPVVISPMSMMKPMSLLYPGTTASSSPDLCTGLT